MMIKAILIVALATIALAKPIHWDKLTEEINKAVDEAIAEIEKSKTLDPMHAPDHQEKFERHVGILDFKGELLVRNIEIRGLSQLKRQGDANVKVADDGKIKADLLLAVHDDYVTIESDIEYHIGDTHPEAHVISDIQDFAIEMLLDITEQGNMTLTEFEVKEYHHVVNHIGGLSVLNPIFGVLSDVLTVFFNGAVRDEITQILGPAFKKELEKNDD